MGFRCTVALRVKCLCTRTSGASAPGSHAVCGMTVTTESPPQAEHSGRPYSFCSAGCRTKFLTEPQKYLALTAAPAEPMPVAAGTLPDQGCGLAGHHCARRSICTEQTELALGGRDVVVHAEAVSRSGRREADAYRRIPRAPAARWGTATLFAMPAFVLVFAAVSLLWTTALGRCRLPCIQHDLHHCLCMDKAAARSGEWACVGAYVARIRLDRLGALLVQQVMRHKSTKAEFRAAFWIAVVVNIGALVTFSSPSGRAWFI